MTAGGIAIIANMLALQAADVIPLATAHGGLLRFVRPWFEPPLRVLDLSKLWSGIGGPSADTPIFQDGFHFVVGLAMALAYAFVLERALPGKVWIKGLIYAAFVWLLNAAIVLPVIGDGFAGRAHVTLAGMIWFAAAHTLFFLLLAAAYSRLRR